MLFFFLASKTTLFRRFAALLTMILDNFIKYLIYDLPNAQVISKFKQKKKP